MVIKDEDIFEMDKALGVDVYSLEGVHLEIQTKRLQQQDKSSLLFLHSKPKFVVQRR